MVEKSKEVLAATLDTEVEDPVEEVRLLKEVATFEEIVVWGHEVKPEGAGDEYLRGLGEWVSLAGDVSIFFSLFVFCF